jgi:hypothetical protein
MRNIYMRPTEKGEVYWTCVFSGDKWIRLIAYRYTRGKVRTRYKIKYEGDKQARWVSVRQLLKEYPLTFSMLRDATGTKEYNL